MDRWPEYTCNCQTSLGAWKNTAIDLCKSRERMAKPSSTPSSTTMGGEVGRLTKRTADEQDVEEAPIGYNAEKGVLACLGILGERVENPHKPDD